MKYLYTTLLLSCIVNAQGITGHVEGRSYFKTNVPAYPDLTGDIMKYGVDFQLNFPTFIKRFTIMAGADAATGSRQFSQVAGRVGFTYRINQLETGFFHRSNHAIDHRPVNNKFLNDNHVFVRYLIGRQ